MARSALAVLRKPDVIAVWDRPPASAVAPFTSIPERFATRI